MLSTDEHRLLELIAQAKEPVAPSSFFHTIHPATFDSNAPDDDPARKEWAERQIGLYGALLRLHDLNLIRIVVPADGANPDLMEVTDDALHIGAPGPEVPGGHRAKSQIDSDNRATRARI
ncbi:hypothetical protein [Streptomyces scabiei]|uniref:hypothetical protein n=1 Tax=Streptomyces scabiei TaxID=1930 RepID=UPI0038F7979B